MKNINECISDAVRDGLNLSDTHIECANLKDVNLYGANLNINNNMENVKTIEELIYYSVPKYDWTRESFPESKQSLLSRLRKNRNRN